MRVLQFVRLARVLDRIGPQVGSAPSLHLLGFALRALSLDKYEGLRC